MKTNKKSSFFAKFLKYLKNLGKNVLILLMFHIFIFIEQTVILYGANILFMEQMLPRK